MYHKNPRQEESVVFLRGVEFGVRGARNEDISYTAYTFMSREECLDKSGAKWTITERYTS